MIGNGIMSDQYLMPNNGMRLASYKNRMNEDFKSQLLLRNPSHNRGKNHFRKSKGSAAGRPPPGLGIGDGQFRLQENRSMTSNYVTAQK